MKSFWDKAIEKYQKGKGIKHRTKRGPIIKASAQYGGMGEREIQLKLELLVDPIISTHNSVIKPARNLCQFNLQDQRRFIASVQNISNTNIELAYNFCQYGVESLKLVDDSQWSNWIQKILNTYSSNGINESVKLMKNSIGYVNSLAGAATSIDFIDFSKVIDPFLTGLNGRPLKLQISDEIYTDTETIYLPERISTQNTKDKNFQLIKASAVHLWAQTWYGTWRVDKNDFDLYENKEQALKAYHILETIRLDEIIKNELPGVGRIIEKLNPKNKLISISKNFKNAVKKLSVKNATYKDSLKLINSIIDEIEKISTAPYAGNLRPDSVMPITETRINKDKINFQKGLDELHKAWGKNDEDIYDEQKKYDENKKTFSVVKENNKNEYDVALGIGEDNISLPQNIRQTMESIIQDHGEIPDNYLDHSRDNGFSNESNNNNKNLSKTENFDYNYVYNEWDHSMQKYRKDWCKLNVHTVKEINGNFVQDTLNKHKGLLKHLNRTFEALRQDNKRLNKQRHGDDIDLDAFVNAYIELKQGNEIDEKLFTKLNKTERNVAVMFMVDMSGSTSGWVNKMEKESLVLLCESLEILGDTYAIYGFSGKTRNLCEVYKIKDFEEKYNQTVKNRICNIEAMDYTRMGASIRHLTMLLNQVEAKTKLLITLSDGKPDDVDGYRGMYGIEDTKKALLESRYLGIHTYCITIDEEAMDYLPYMYGQTNFAVINQIDKLPIKVSEIYRKITV
ncbi:MAG: hypothetical protein HN613_02375 [Gammaproteobacteria bacterium]|jgi:nitric oxide reductase NorD protein|nr:hypothetical protein [Gammaproteobacteria bacterium]MBT7603523.1 hypothetical protein [Gammaproteobacteria bacterium]